MACILAMLSLLLLFRKSTSCISNLPLFVNNDEDPSPPRLPPSVDLGKGIQVLIPSYRFECDGRILRWGVAVEGSGRSSMWLQIWRPEETEGGKTFKRVFSMHNSLHPLREDLVLQIQDLTNGNEDYSVMKGDVLGFHLRGELGLQYQNASQGGVVLLYDQVDKPLEEICQDTLSSQLINAAPTIKITMGEQFKKRATFKNLVENACQICALEPAFSPAKSRACSLSSEQDQNGNEGEVAWQQRGGEMRAHTVCNGSAH